MSNDLLEVQLLWSQTIAQVVTAVEMTELMALWEWEANGLNHGSGSLIKHQDPAMSNILTFNMFSLINIVRSSGKKRLRYIVLSFLLFLCISHYLVITTFPCPFLWQFECQSLECPAVGLLCEIQPLMFSCKHCIGKMFVCFAWSTSPPIPHFCHSPQSVDCLSLSQQHFLILRRYIVYLLLSHFCFCLAPPLSNHPPSPPSLSLLSLLCPPPPTYHLTHCLSLPFSLLSPPCFSLLRTDLLSLHWWPWWFSWMVHSLPGASPRPFSAACSWSSTR